MARSDAVWGIDVGQCALKALRCRPHDERNKIVADAFDYIEYPKILSQAGAEPAELISDALKQFLSRNAVRGDRVAISVSGQSGLARFIKLPPVEAKKIPDIVRYEARQQIPFDLNDVIWDYQRMGGGSEEEGFALETEVGLFAMKRDAVFRTLEPFQKAGIEVDFVQLTPLALYNFILFDQLTDLPPPDEYDPEDPPDSLAVLSLGTDATDLVVTNGYRVWQRSIPLGGNHFTKALTKGLKLTFAKAEHLKRNATAAQDPKAVFQAMRPVFSDLLTELQRSIGYFTSIDRAAKISRVVGLGNTMKLPGLRRYLSQSLGYEVRRLDEFRGLSGAQVLAAPAFKDNSLSFAVCYGLALQALGKSGLRTNLLPGEIVQDRLIRQKKPWAVAAAALLLLACSISFATFSLALGTVDGDDPNWKSAENRASDTAKRSAEFKSQKDAALGEFDEIKKIGEHLVGNVERRVLWAELLRAVNECLPHDPQGERPEQITPEVIIRRDELHLTNLECQHVDDLSAWFESVSEWYEPPEEPDEPNGSPESDPAAPAGTPNTPANAAGGAGTPPATAETAVEGPSGPGWVVQLQGYHYHNPRGIDQRANYGTQFVRKTLIKNLHTKSVILPNGDGTEKKPVSMEELGIGFPVLVSPQKVHNVPVTNANENGRSPGHPRGAQDTMTLPRLDFIVQFCWKPTSPSQREAEQKEAEQNGEPTSP